MTRLLMVVAALAGLVACNPLPTDPETIGGELDRTAAAYEGPDRSWFRIAVTGAPDHAVYAFALIGLDDLRGPEQRGCAPQLRCDVTPIDVRMPNQRLVRGDGSQTVRLMTVWAGERIQVVLVCVDPDTQELGCPTSLRTRLSVADADGVLAGDLTPAFGSG